LLSNLIILPSVLHGKDITRQKCKNN
jgi:hypothetical protein